MKKHISKMTLALATLSSVAWAQEAPIDLSRITKEFQSPSGLTEYCIALAKLPLGKYKKKDLAEEQRLCAFNFHNDTLALCPKTWSTSPATIVASFLDVDGKNLANSSAEAEHSLCRKDTTMDKLAKFKQTMNQSNTSGTFSGSSIMYYHFSRALDADVNIPVAVYRTMDMKEHYSRVSKKASPPASAKMNVAGWDWLRKAEENPAGYNQASDLFTSDRQQIYGVLLKDKGERYKEEINGTRERGWGKGQNYDFQETPAFFALKEQAALTEAIHKGYDKAIRNPKIKAAVPTRPSQAQMILWMNEVSEIVILDYIFSQQDRIGNIDFRWYWAYIDAQEEFQTDRVKEDEYEELPRLKMHVIKPPAAIAGFQPTLVQKTFMGDNDAGGLVQYANFTKTTGMVDGLAHLNKGTYQRVLKLARDFAKKGENYQVIAREFATLNVTEGNKRLNQTVGNTILVASLLEKKCQAGTLRLDLVSFKKAMKGQFETQPTNCAIKD